METKPIPISGSNSEWILKIMNIEEPITKLKNMKMYFSGSISWKNSQRLKQIKQQEEKEKPVINTVRLLTLPKIKTLQKAPASKHIANINVKKLALSGGSDLKNIKFEKLISIVRIDK